MLVYCTYCSAQKNQTTEPIPAIELYRSYRIMSIYSKAQDKGVDFVILSGKYGVIDASEKIKHYDHLLKASEVEEHSNKIAAQLKNARITQLVFFMNSITNDKNLQPYLDCMVKACQKSGVSLEISEQFFAD